MNVNELLQLIGLAVLEAVEAAGDIGAPAGVLYAGLQAQGATKNQFDSFMSGLTGRGMLSLDDAHCYHLTAAGIEFLQKLKRKFAGANTAQGNAGAGTAVSLHINQN